MYLDKVALKFHKNYEGKHRNLSWVEIKKTYSTVFTPVQEKELLLWQLNNRVQLPRDSVIKYRTDYWAFMLAIGWQYAWIET